MKFFWQPSAGVRWLFGFGLRGAFQMKWGEIQMRRAVRNLPAVEFSSSSPFEATYMTGRNHWHQTAFAAWSLAKVLPGGLRPTFYDDGTLQADAANCLRRIFPSSRIVSRAEASDAMDEFMPRARFPMLRAAEDRCIFMRKLVALRAGSRRWQLYLDSDMLFFRRPEQLELAAKNSQAIYMVDHGHFYCLKPEEAEAILGCPVLERVNGGLVGLADHRIDWVEVETWLARMSSAARQHSMLEQTLTAMLMTRQSAQAAFPKNYRLMWIPDTPPPEAVLIHYLYHSKQSFLANEWRRVLTLHSKIN